jgi:hypothetical protein
MVEAQNKPSFWTTLPGILTGVAALITAVGGLLVAVHYHGPNAKPQDDPTVVGQPKTTPEQPRTVVDQPKTAPEQPHKAIVTLTETDGTTLTVDASSLEWEMGPSMREFTLSTGQSIPFDKIKTIDVLEAGDRTTTVQVTLTDGRTLQGVVDGGRYAGFRGESDIGHVRVGIGMLRQIRFQR